MKCYSEWLLSIAGEGLVESLIQNNNIIELPPRMICTSKIDLENKVFDIFQDNYTSEQYLADRAIMSSKNDTIQQCNYEMIEKIPGDVVISESIDKCVEAYDVKI